MLHACIHASFSMQARLLVYIAILLEGGRVIGVEEGDGSTDAEADSIIADNIGVVVVGDIVP